MKDTLETIILDTHYVELPNKGHVGDNINSAVVSIVVSFVESLSSLWRFKMY